jgi:hypothetical protein
MTDQPSRYWDIEGCQWVRCEAPSLAQSSAETSAEPSAMPEQRATEADAAAETIAR